jgi:hypothetical protein
MRNTQILPGTDSWKPASALRALSAALVLGSCLTLNASIYSYSFDSGFANSGNIPDANPTGWSDARTISGITDSQITDVTVSLNISGGFNGDLYGYLSHDGVLVPLLNRVGVAASSPGSSFGYSNHGFDVTLSDSGAYDVHFYGRNSPTINDSGQLTETWQPDGRNIDPNSSPTSFDSAGRVTFAAYDVTDPNGTWTLFFADMSGGGGQSTLNSWELAISTVPEPVEAALALMAGLFLVVRLCRSACVLKVIRMLDH